MYEEHKVGRRSYYIAGAPGMYAVKACGNNRILCRFATLDQARAWLTS